MEQVCDNMEFPEDKVIAGFNLICPELALQI